MTSTLILATLLALLALLAGSDDASTADQPLDEARVAAIAAMLPPKPAGLGCPIDGREAWQRLASLPAYQDAVRKAEALLDRPLPEQPDDLYLDFSRTGNRTRWQRVSAQRRGRVTVLVLAECVEDRGRFLPVFDELVAALCAEPTWVMPAHDRALTNFRGETVDIDLASSALGWQLATADYLLGDRLSDTTRGLIRENVERRILEPFRDMVSGKRRRNGWLTTTNNWNAVCLAGVVGAALAQVEPRDDRARFVAAAEHYSRFFLRGFTPDGYCSEGLGYWNYGFGHYVLLSEMIRLATADRVDLLARPEATMPALFPVRNHVSGGVYPAFADCSIRAQPDPNIMFILNQRFGLGLNEYATLNAERLPGSLFTAMLLAVRDEGPRLAAPIRPSPDDIRVYFEAAGILVSRPSSGSSSRLAVALKGGHNAEHHNHNDVGSYVVVLGDRPLLLDPGTETYTARTFSRQRYDSKLLNSYGHPVPVVAGKLQRPGRDARGEVLRAEFSDAADVFELDLRSAYDVPELKRLTRTFVYSREGGGSLTITDRVEFASPQRFGSALITLGGWQRTEPKRLLIYDVDEAVEVELQCDAAELELAAEVIEEDGSRPTRISINLARPVTEATLAVRIAPGPEMEGDGLLRNGSFEHGFRGWDLPHGSMGSISDEQAASGSFSLKIVDDDTQLGSNVTSARIPVEGGQAFELRGKLYPVSGSGIGMYVRFRDGERRLLNPVNSRGHIQPLGTLSGPAGGWAPFIFRFQTLPGTDSMDVWIHSYSSAMVVAYLDNLEIVAAEEGSR